MKAILIKPVKERLLKQFEKSGKKTRTVCTEENGLNVKTLSKWIYDGVIRLRVQTK